MEKRDWRCILKVDCWTDMSGKKREMSYNSQALAGVRKSFTRWRRVERDTFLEGYV